MIKIRLSGRFFKFHFSCFRISKYRISGAEKNLSQKRRAENEGAIISISKTTDIIAILVFPRKIQADLKLINILSRL